MKHKKALGFYIINIIMQVIFGQPFVRISALLGYGWCVQLVWQTRHRRL